MVDNNEPEKLDEDEVIDLTNEVTEPEEDDAIIDLTEAVDEVEKQPEMDRGGGRYLPNGRDTARQEVQRGPEGHLLVGDHPRRVDLGLGPVALVSVRAADVRQDLCDP